MASVSSKAQLREEVAGWNPGQIWQAPTNTQRLLDSAFRRLCFGFAAFTILLIAWLVLEIALRAVPAIREYGLGFIYGTTWDPNKAQYGILPEIWGTLYTSLLALAIGSAFGVAAAIFLSEGYLGEFVFKILKSANLHAHPVLGKASRTPRTVIKKSYRAAGRSSQRRLRFVGIVRDHSHDPACLQLVACAVWLGSFLLDDFERTRSSARGICFVHHDSTDDYGNQP